MNACLKKTPHVNCPIPLPEGEASDDDNHDAAASTLRDWLYEVLIQILSFSFQKQICFECY